MIEPVRYFEFQLDENSSVIIETLEPGGRKAGPVGAAQTVERAKTTFNELISRIPSIVEPIHAQLVKSAPKADQVKVEFGMKVSGDFGIIIAKTQAEANFKITFAWKGEKGA